jgi:endoglucanase
MTWRIGETAACLGVIALIAALGLGFGYADAGPTDANEVTVATEAAQSAGSAFLDDYVDTDGRVIRQDLNGDVASEGQAYAMLISAAIGDEPRFRQVWSRTKTNLLRPDGVLSWRWSNGAIIDANSAADADVDAARALLIAGQRFHAPDLVSDGKRLAAGVLATETVAVDAKSLASVPPFSAVGADRVLVAGSWAVTAPYQINTSYLNPRAEQDMLTASSDDRWNMLIRGDRVLAGKVMSAAPLPPDWAILDTSGNVAATGPPAGGPIEFGLDAARVPIRMAESCDPADRALAASMRDILDKPVDPPGIRHLDGSPAADFKNPIALVAAAAADHAAGDQAAARNRLGAAADLQRRYPTWYGAAWVALGRIMLDTSLLGDCG